MKSKLDFIYRSLLITRIFVKGWGQPRVLQTLLTLKKHFAVRQNIENFINSCNTSVKITDVYHFDDHQVMRGEFDTPLIQKFPFLVPEAAHSARFEVVLPTCWKHPKFKPVCIHLAGTGDHYYWRRRRFMVKPLIRDAGIGAIILENPFYGSRKPKDQVRSNLHYVSDIFVMGACLILECFVLLKWCEKQGFGPLGVTGVSMGGHMASLAAAAWPKPLILVPCLSWTTASSVFTEGVMSKSINWELLAQQFYSNTEFGRLLENRKVSNLNGSSSGFLKNHSLFHAYERIDAFNLRSYFEPNKLTTRVASKVMDVIHVQIFKEHRDYVIVDYMKQLMDEFTDLRNYPKLVEPSLCISLYALHDAYVPKEGCVELGEIWKGADIRYIKTGHVSAILVYNYLFRQCIIEAFNRAKEMENMKNFITPCRFIADHDNSKQPKLQL